MKCVNLELSIRVEQSYRDSSDSIPQGKVRASASLRFTIDGYTYGGDAALGVPLTRLNLESLLASSPDQEVYGSALSEMVFEGNMGTGWSQAYRLAEGLHLPLRVRLHIDEAPQLQQLKWELLKDPIRGDFIAMSEKTLFSRYLESRTLLQPFSKKSRPRTALIIGASPRDLPVYNKNIIDIEREVHAAQRALGRISTTVLAHNIGSAPPTFANLLRALENKPDILYFVCHGTSFNDEFHLWMESERRESHRIEREVFAQAMRSLRQHPRIAFLNVCESGSTSAGSPASLGSLMARAGIPAVIAMQGMVPTGFVTSMLEIFFSRLFNHGCVDLALTEARRYSGTFSELWWLPVLYLRITDGMLWNRRFPWPNIRLWHW